MLPENPTTVQILTSEQETPFRLPVAPVDCSTQVVPPSVVRRTAFPTVVYVLLSGHETALKKYPK
jgi:hypothetical protein